MTNPHLLTREHFPVHLYKAKSPAKSGRWAYEPIGIPPPHPSWRETGLPFELVPSVLDTAVQETIRDLEEVAPYISHAQHLLEQERLKPHVQQDERGIHLIDVPLINSLRVDRKRISPYGGDHNISLNPGEVKVYPFYIPKTVPVSDELRQEYNLQERPSSLRDRCFECPNGWYRHNLYDVETIFYKNLVIALDNETVKRKYGGK